MKKTKRNKYLTKKRSKTKKYRKRGGEGERDFYTMYTQSYAQNQKDKYDFRNQFMNAFKRLQENPVPNLDLMQEIFILFEKKQYVINTLIPVTNNYIPISKYRSSVERPLVAFVPILSILIFHIRDIELKKMCVENFIKNKGNVNLTSLSKNITALSTAIQINDAKISEYLIANGADKNILTDEQKAKLTRLLPDVPPPIQPIEIQKLILPTELPPIEGYNIDTEPEFWSPIFAPNEMMTLRENLHTMMIADTKIEYNEKISEMWSVCKIIKTIIPTYYVPEKNVAYQVYNTFYYDQSDDFSNYNILVCAALLVYGIISHKMNGQDYDILFKGGKATQLVLSNLVEYETEDIDILIKPKSNIAYDPNITKNLSGHIAFLVKWFMHMPDKFFRISVLAPNPENKRANPYIYKLSYVKKNQRRDYARGMVDEFRPISDIDFKETPSELVEESYFENVSNYPFTISELQTEVLFKTPNLGALLNEKMYYYAKYKKIIQDNRPIPEEGLTIEECRRLLDKFKRSIVAMNRGLQMQKQKKQKKQNLTEKELKENEKNLIKTRLNKIGVTDMSLINAISDDLTN